eukprot:TRINITY_DN36058_c0_g1_i1.p1 TRINITY_DN36058_c0_g1~~TRINITY_DN36058_c0_g1_i1.p1  ORF type:complete len:320 (+),score=25.57 TRINITY_DN36058_c0_g1_i1:107-961(+)
MAVDNMPLSAQSVTDVEEQRSYDRWYRIKDVIGLPIFVAWYYVQALVLEQQGTLKSTRAPLLVTVSLVVGSLVPIAVLGEQLSIPPPRQNDEQYSLMLYTGRWIFLTRHGLTLQAIHMVLSSIAAWFAIPRLLQLTDGMTFWIGSLGCFVTVQFFALVWNHPDFKERCARLAAQNPPVNLKRKAASLHAPGLFIAVLDAWVGKSHENLSHGCSILASLGMVGFYAVLYTCLIVLNFKMTGAWPYGVLKALTSAPRWVAFILGQMAILTVFCLGVAGIARLPAVW